MAPPGLVYIVIYLATGSSAAGLVGFAPYSSPPFRPLLHVRGGDVSSTVHPPTSLQSSIITAVDTFYKTMPLASAFLTVCVMCELFICFYFLFLPDTFFNLSIIMLVRS